MVRFQFPIPHSIQDVPTTSTTDVAQTPFQTAGMGLGPEGLELPSEVVDLGVFLSEEFDGSFSR